MNTPNNTIYLRRQNKICVPPPNSGAWLPINYVASVLKNIEPLGFTFSESLIEACRSVSVEQLTAFYQSLVADLRKIKGAHQQHKPMYPNFPAQVMEASEGQLYFNAIVHYLTDGRFLPVTERKARLPLLDNPDLVVIDLGTPEEFERLFSQIAGSNTSLSEHDKEDLAWFVRTFGDVIGRLLPDAVPQKENMAYIAGLLLQHTEDAESFIARFSRTATDVLRLTVAMSGGDVSLAAVTKFRSFSRAERKFLLGLLERQENLTEDMLRWKGRWIRLGERLHPREFSRRFIRVAEAFRILRNDVPFPTFNGRVEQALAQHDTALALASLATRAGDLARRMDHLLRQDSDHQELTLAAFRDCAGKVSTPVLLQVMRHFKGRCVARPLRVFFPKGNLAKAYAASNELPALSEAVANRVADICQEALVSRFSALPSLGKVYVDEALEQYIVPFASRSASRSFRTVARGSRLPLPAECRVLRFFIWWKNGADRTDIDLSASTFDSAFNYMDIVSYYNLKNYGGCHSGDIVDAPQGASEFIDILLEKVQEQRVRYVVMTINSYTQQPFCDLPECFAGWMARENPDSGEIYEPKTVQGRLDVTADTRIAIPLIIDVVEKQVVWCDMALRRNPRWNNNVHANLKGVNLTLQALTTLNKPNLYELFMLHAMARGERVDSPDLADTIFSVATGTPFRQEEIAAEYLA